MVAGTDGTDFSHRERVADQYSVSATNKARLKLLVILHLGLGLLHNVRLLPSLLSRVGLSVPASILSSLPAPASTEYLWLLSLPFTFMALSACKRSRAGPLQVFQVVILICCVSSLLLTLLLLLPETVQYVLEGSHSPSHLSHLSINTTHSGPQKTQTEILGLPFGPVWSVFLLFNLIVHVMQIIVCRTLVQAWAPRHGKKS